MFGVAERIFFQSKIFSMAEKRSGLRSIDQMSGITTVLPKCRVLLLQYLLPPHLHSYGFSGLLPVEDSTGGELRLQGVLLDGGLHRPTFTVYDHVGVCTCMTTCISVKGDDAGETLVFRGGSTSSDLLCYLGSEVLRLRGRRCGSRLEGNPGMNSSTGPSAGRLSAPCEGGGESQQ